jgi:hypothetical protein
VWLAVAAGWCAASCAAPADDAQRCRDAIAARRPALEICLDAFAQRREPAIGALLAHAHVRVGDLAGAESVARTIGDHDGGAQAWHVVASERHRTGDITGAIEAYRRALAHRARGDLAGRGRDAVALLELFHTGDDFQTTLEYAALAYGIAEQLPDDRELRARVAVGSIAVLVNLGDRLGATRMFEVAAARIGQDSEYWPYVPYYRAMLAAEGERCRSARHGFAQARTVARAAGYAHIDRAALLSLIEAEATCGSADEAARLLVEDEVADPSPNQRGSHARASAQVAFARGEPRQALAALDAALAAGVGPTWRWELEDLRARALISLGDDAAAEVALQASIGEVERLRDAAGLDELKAWALADRRHPYEQLFRLQLRRGETLEAWGTLQRATARSYLDGLVTGDAAAARSPMEVLRDAGRRAESLRAIASSLRASPAAEPPPTRALLIALADRTVLSYFVAEQDVWLMALRGGALSAHRLPIDAGELDALVDDLGADDDRALARLGAVLLPRAALPPSGAIHIVPDGPLVRVPFAALPAGRRLVETHDIAYAPSAAVLAQVEARTAPGGAPVVLGDSLGNLPAARDEAAWVAARLGVPPRLGGAATAVALRSAREASILHVAAHAELSARGAQLRLADRPLPASEILEAGLHPGLVVLASCVSAAAPHGAPWGALAGSFLAAGSRTVVASLWTLDDRAARRMIERFYDAGGVRDPVRALGDAQRAAAMAGEPLRAWAGFVVFGAGRSPPGQ